MFGRFDLCWILPNHVHDLSRTLVAGLERNDMGRKRIIIAAVGEKGVTYGVGRDGRGTPIPRPLFELIATSKADSWTLTRGGAVAYFSASRRSFKHLERFLERAEALREDLPRLCIGLAEGCLHRKFNWFQLRYDHSNDLPGEERAFANVRAEQTEDG